MCYETNRTYLACITTHCQRIISVVYFVFLWNSWYSNAICLCNNFQNVSRAMCTVLVRVRLSPSHRISASISYELHMGTDIWYLSMQTLTANASRVIEPFSKCIRIHVTKTEEHICPVSCVGHFCRKKTRKRRYFWQTDILHNLHMKKVTRNSCKIWTL